MPKKTFTKAEKERALELLETESVWVACAEVGCSHTSVYRWQAEFERSLKKSDKDLAQEDEELQIHRRILKRRLLTTARAHVDRSDAARSAKDALDYAKAAGIMLDKFRLEMGEHTERWSNVSPIDLELERVRAEYERQISATSDS